jgi:hypothetical protein
LEVGRLPMNKAQRYLDEEARDAYIRRTKVLQFADSLSDSKHKEAVMKYADQLGQQYLLLVEMTKQVADSTESATA